MFAFPGWISDWLPLRTGVDVCVLFFVFLQSRDVWRWWSWCHAEETQQQHRGHACRKVGTVCVTSSSLRLSDRHPPFNYVTTFMRKLWNTFITISSNDWRVTSGPSTSSQSSVAVCYIMNVSETELSKNSTFSSLFATSSKNAHLFIYLFASC